MQDKQEMFLCVSHKKTPALGFKLNPNAGVFLPCFFKKAGGGLAGETSDDIIT